MREEDYIALTKDDLERRFKEYNEIYFEGILPKCHLTIGGNQEYGYGGYVNPKKGKPRIYLCQGVYWTDDSLKLILIHEMVHHYVSTIVKPPFGETPHGYQFNKKCKQLLTQYGLKVGLHNSPKPFFKREIVPTTWLGKLRRRLWGAKFSK